MSELNLAPAQVIGAVQSENANIPAGFVDLGPRSFSLKTSGSYTSLDQVRDTVIASVEGRIVRIRDVAEVSWSTAAYSYTGRYKGKRAVFVTANQKDGYNILDVRERVVAAAKRFAADLPKRIEPRGRLRPVRQRALRGSTACTATSASRSRWCC